MALKKTPRKLSETEFQRIFNEVRSDINELQLHNKVFAGVIGEFIKYPQLQINFRVFFHAFGNAMRTDLIIRLGRVYDPEGTGHASCTLSRCLTMLRDNPQFFSHAAITGRLTADYRAANPDFLKWHRADIKRIESDLASIEQNRKRLINLRHKVYAHKDLETVLTGKRDDLLSSQQEVDDLIQLAHEAWNRHSQVWNASTYAAMTIGEDDYKWLFKYVRRGMKVKSLLDLRQFERWQARTQRALAAMRLDDATVTMYCERFLGYGHPDAPIWFVGIEEAGGRRILEVDRRLKVWNDRESQTFEDAPRFYPLCGHQQWYGNNAKAQDSWRKLILMLSVARGLDATEEAIIEYQRTSWGAIDGSTCLMELLPLPSPSTADWNYGQWSELTWLNSREAYLARVRAGRENELRRRIQEHQPKVVIFYGLELARSTSLLPSWSSIAGGRFAQAVEDREILLTRTNGKTTYYVTRHPRAESDAYFREIGQFLRRKHESQI